MLVNRSSDDDVLATEVGMRGDIPRQHFLLLLGVPDVAHDPKIAQARFGAAGEQRLVLLARQGAADPGMSR